MDFEMLITAMRVWEDVFHGKNPEGHNTISLLEEIRKCRITLVDIWLNSTDDMSIDRIMRDNPEAVKEAKRLLG